MSLLPSTPLFVRFCTAYMLEPTDQGPSGQGHKSQQTYLEVGLAARWRTADAA